MVWEATYAFTSCCSLISSVASAVGLQVGAGVGVCVGVAAVNVVVLAAKGDGWADGARVGVCAIVARLAHALSADTGSVCGGKGKQGARGAFVSCVTGAEVV